MSADLSPLLTLDNLHVQFRTDAGTVRAVDGVSYTVRRGETLAIVGESGCGKSVTSMAILRLIESQRGEITAGSIVFDGQELTTKTQEEMRKIRGNDIAMIFQEPMTSLNPVFTVGQQITESLSLHRGLDDDEARAEAIRLLELVRMPAAAQRVDEFPHQLSGGMRQRVMIAMALACSPKLLIADEPTTALDVTVQAQILELLAQLQSELGMSVLLITHDLGVVARVAHRVAVMYAGRVVEQANVYELFENPKHPYTAGLFHSLPHTVGKQRLRPIEGNVPDALNFPSGCRFHPRCALRIEKCRTQQPPEALFELRSPAPGTPRSADTHTAACWVTQEQPERDLLAAPEERNA
ncbi:MAG: hypothetical protein RJA70_449 [Pseudomonadota bacterium]|jgi:oligopeptide/dipeptide ABC transporter ATP-binding protein